MILLFILILLLIAFGFGGIAVHALWIVAVIALILLLAALLTGRY